MAQAFVQNGAVISDDGKIVRWHPVCPKCGYVHINVTMQGFCQYGTLNPGTAFCQKCRELIRFTVVRS